MEWLCPWLRGSEIEGPAFLALRVQRLEAATSWYASIFSLDVVNEIDAEDGRYRIRILDSPSLTVELIDASATIPHRS